MKVIIPCAGKSSRFPNTRPKYMLTMPDGELMLQHAARNWINNYNVTFVINREHDEKYGSAAAIRRIYGDTVDIRILEEFTSGPAETVYETIKDWENTAFYVQDCDSHFDVEFDITELENSVVYIELGDYPKLDNIAAKSFVKLHESLLTTIVEKHVVSDKVCVGGYRFGSSDNYKCSYTKLKKIFTNELFISHVIKHMMLNGDVFSGTRAKNYVDCGTYDAFIEYQRKRQTIFCNLDGVVFMSQSHYFDNHYGNEPELKPYAIEYLLNKVLEGATIVFTTSRPERYRDITTRALDSAGFVDYRIIFDLPHAPHLLINGVSTTNPWPSASSINAPCNDDEFWQKLK